MKNAWLLLFLSMLAGCAGFMQSSSSVTELIEVARSEKQWTGVAVSHEGRIFVNYPRWSDDVPVSVAEILPTGAIKPYPDETWNHWAPGLSPKEHFVCVQSVHVDDENFLWILDPASPGFKGVVKNGPKLLKVDLSSDKIVQIIYFKEAVAPLDSYLNDIRVDTELGFAYLSESGEGSLIVIDLQTGQSRRVLHGHDSTKSEGITLTIEGKPWLGPDGKPPHVHADGIALTPSCGHVYFQALTGRTLYRIETRWLRDRTLTESALGYKVEFVAESGASDAILFDEAGHLYLSALEHDAVNRLTPEGKVETVAKHDLLAWPDSFSRGPEGYIYVSTAQIHRGPEPGEPYRIFRFKPND